MHALDTAVNGDSSTGAEGLVAKVSTLNTTIGSVNIGKLFYGLDSPGLSVLWRAAARARRRAMIAGEVRM